MTITKEIKNFVEKISDDFSKEDKAAFAKIGFDSEEIGFTKESYIKEYCGQIESGEYKDNLLSFLKNEHPNYAKELEELLKKQEA